MHINTGAAEFYLVLQKTNKKEHRAQPKKLKLHHALMQHNPKFKPCRPNIASLVYSE
jgi:hypothetical protein